MFVIKRNGASQSMMFDKITSRLNILMEEAQITDIDAVSITQLLVQRMISGISTEQIDELACQIIMGKIHEGQKYGKLASRLAISNYHKTTSSSFKEVIRILRNNKDPCGEIAPLVSEELETFSIKYENIIEDMIHHERDYLIDYFGICTLKKAYLLKSDNQYIERPQHLFMRVALGIHGLEEEPNFAKIKRTYDGLSLQKFMHATPTLFHAGTTRPQMASCFTENMEVCTSKGVKKINQVIIGDYVVSHTGKTQKVTQIHTNNLNGRKLVNVSFYKGKNLEVTENHKFWAMYDKTDKPKWYRIDQLDTNSFIGIPNKQDTEFDLKCIDLAEYNEEFVKSCDYNTNIKEESIEIQTIYQHTNFGYPVTINKSHTNINRFWNLDNDFYFMSGCFLGDGHIMTSNKKGYRYTVGIGFTFNTQDKELIEKIRDISINLFGIEPTEHQMKNQNTFQILINSHYIGYVFEKLFGKNFNNKKLPDFVYSANKEKVNHLVAGLISTDGCISKQRIVTLQLSNYSLMSQIYHLSRNNNIDVSFTINKYKPKLATVKPVSIRFPSNYDYMKFVIKTYTDDRLKQCLTYTHNTKNQYHPIEINGNKFLKIKSISEIEPKSQLVYTIGVDNDHSYNIEGVLCENCFLIGTEDSVEGIYGTITDCAKISKWAGGIGVHIHDIRSEGSYIRKTGGRSDGIMPMLKVYDSTARYINQCFTPDTHIYTKDGMKQIQDINKNDFVVTMDGSYKRVNEVIINPKNEKIYSIRTKGSIFNTKCTGAHEIYALTGIKKMTYTTKIIKNLKEGKIKPSFVSAENLDANSDFLVFPIPNDIYDDKNITEDICRFYGIMLGDGHFTKKKNCNSIEWGVTLGYSKDDTIQFIKQFLDTNSINFWEHEGTNCKNIRWTFSNKISFTYDMLYDSNHEKYIHSNFLNLPKNKLLYLIKGLMETDGSIGNELYYHSSSLSLIENIRFIFLKCGILTSGHARDTIEKVSSYRNITTKKQQYVIRIPKHKTICDVLGDDSSNKLNFFEYDGKLFSRIREIKTIDYEGNVYDLNIEDNHNYLTHMGLVHNSGKRNGSFAMYLEPWHADIIKFLHAKRAQGVEEERARDLFYALWIPDLFMERVQKDQMWSLMCPDECKGLSDCYGDEFVKLYENYEKEEKYKSQISARKLWENIVTCQIESGVPYMCYKDAANTKSNQSNIGIIKSSNLCVSGDSKVITDKGVYDILSLKDTMVNVWNGFEFSSVKVEQTGENKDLHKITFSNHEELLCTPYHKFYIQKDYKNTKPTEVRAEDLEEGMKIIKCNFPIIPDNNCEFENAYTHGLFCADGTYDIKPGNVRQCSFSKTNNSKYCKTHMYQQTYDFSQFNQVLKDNNKCQAVCGIKIPKIYLYDKKKKLVEYIKHNHNASILEDDKKITVFLPQDLQEKYFVPYNHSINSKLRWLEGYLDGDGCVCIEKIHKTQSIQCVSTELSFIKDIKTLLHTLGCNPTIGIGHTKRQELLPNGKGGKKLYDCKETYRLCISAYDTQNLLQLGLAPKRLVIVEKEIQRSASRFTIVKKIDKNFTKENTYCFNEHKRHYGVFNGIITGQCAEIFQYSDAQNPSVCNLASINLKAMLKNPPNLLINITIISKPNCFYCKLLKYFLSSRGIRYLELNKEDSRLNTEILEMQEKYGDINYKTVPQVFGEMGGSEFCFLGGFWDVWEHLRPVIDYKQLKDVAQDLTYNLNKVIDRNFYPLEGAKKTNFDHRPIGIGVQGLADMFAEMLVPFDSDLAKRINKEIFETIYYGAMKASIELAEKDGPYSSFKDSPLSKGKFQFNLWGLEDNELSGIWDWGELREQLLKRGARNSLLTALMPTASTAQILGNNECFEPFTSNIYTRSTIAGEFTMINSCLMKLLENIGIWNKDFENMLIYNRGSIQNIKELPQDFKNVFKTVWEISQKKYIELSAERGPFICQSQSLNIWFAKPTFTSLYKAHMLGWSLGLKTGSYYVRQLPAINAQRLGMSASVEKSLKEEVCESCSA